MKRYAGGDTLSKMFVLRLHGRFEQELGELWVYELSTRVHHELLCRLLRVIATAQKHERLLAAIEFPNHRKHFLLEILVE